MVDGIPDRENSSDGITGYAELDGMTYTAKYDYGGSFDDDPPPELTGRQRLRVHQRP